MNAVEIEEAISTLAEQTFDASEFPFAFLEAFGNKDATIKRLRAGATNKSDLGGVLQTNHIHIRTCGEGQVSQTLAALKLIPLNYYGSSDKRLWSTVMIAWTVSTTITFLGMSAIAGAASREAQLMVPIRQLSESFNKGDMKAAAATM